MITLDLFDQPYLVNAQGTAYPEEIVAFDGAEEYSDGNAVDGLNKGYNWNGAWVSRFGVVAMLAYDDAEDYSDGNDIDALNGGDDWGGAWMSERNERGGSKGFDDAESYNDADSVDGLSGGACFNGNWVSR